MNTRAQDTFAAPEACRTEAHRRWASWSLSDVWQVPVRALSRGQWLQPNHAGPLIPHDASGGFSVVDSILLQQGPSYLLAKRLQQWRAIVAQSQGIKVSCNVAPASETVSVVSNRILKAAYGGSAHFGFEAFPADTSRALVAALLALDATSAPCVVLRHADGALICAHAGPRSVILLTCSLATPATTACGISAYACAASLKFRRPCTTSRVLRKPRPWPLRQSVLDCTSSPSCSDKYSARLH